MAHVDNCQYTFGVDVVPGVSAQREIRSSARHVVHRIGKRNHILGSMV